MRALAISAEILQEAWIALRRGRTRSLLTMLGIVWGIVAVTLLIAYGSGFRHVLVHAFQRFRQERGHLLAAANQRAARRASAPARR